MLGSRHCEAGLGKLACQGLIIPISEMSYATLGGLRHPQAGRPDGVRGRAAGAGDHVVVADDHRGGTGLGGTERPGPDGVARPRAHGGGDDAVVFVRRVGCGRHRQHLRRVAHREGHRGRRRPADHRAALAHRHGHRQRRRRHRARRVAGAALGITGVVLEADLDLQLLALVRRYRRVGLRGSVGCDVTLGVVGVDPDPLVGVGVAAVAAIRLGQAVGVGDAPLVGGQGLAHPRRAGDAGLARGRAVGAGRGYDREAYLNFVACRPTWIDGIPK